MTKLGDKIRAWGGNLPVDEIEGRVSFSMQDAASVVRLSGLAADQYNLLELLELKTERGLASQARAKAKAEEFIKEAKHEDG